MAAYIVGYNMVGYLPESDPYAFDSHEDAKQYLIDTLLRDADWIAETSEDQATELTHDAEDLNLVKGTDSNSGQWSTIVGNMSYWLNYEPNVNADEYNGEAE